jgi:iron complex transport system substrate-binding protein
VVALHAHDFKGMFRDLRTLGRALGADARPLERSLRGRVGAVVARARRAPRRKVFCMEWLDPVYCSGHWVPEMVAMAGGRDDLARARKASARVEWTELAAAAPEKLILMPCGFTMERTRSELSVVRRRPEWARLPAVRSGEVYLADGPSYSNGAGPRLVDGLEILAGIIHPELFARRHRRGFVKLGA